MTERHFDSQRNRDALDRWITDPKDREFYAAYIDFHTRYGGERMSKASERAVRYIDANLPDLVHGRMEPQDMITNIMHWCDAHRELWDSEGLDEVAHYIVHQAQYHYEAEVGEGDDLANDPFYEEVNHA